MRTSRAVMVVAAVSAGLLLLTGCSSASDTTTGEPSTETPLAPVEESIDPGEVQGGYNAEIPADWPADVPLPEGMDLQAALRTEMPEGLTFTATYSGAADPTTVFNDLASGLEANGYTAKGTFGGGSDGGVGSWEKGNTVVQVTVVKESAGTAVNITALQKP